MAQVAVAISSQDAVVRRAVSPNVLRTSALQAQFLELEQQWQELKENRPVSRARSRPLSRQSPDGQLDAHQTPAPPEQSPAAAAALPDSAPAQPSSAAKFSTPQPHKKKAASRPPWNDKLNEEPGEAAPAKAQEQQAPSQQQPAHAVAAQSTPKNPALPAAAATTLTLTVITPSSDDPLTTPMLRGSTARGIASLSPFKHSSDPPRLSPPSPGAQPITASGDVSPAASISDVSSLKSPTGHSGLPDSPGTVGARSPHSRIPVPSPNARSTSVPRGGHSRIPCLAQSGGAPRNSLASVQASSEMPLDASSSYDITSLGASASTLPSPAGHAGGHSSGPSHHREPPAASRRGPSQHPRLSEGSALNAAVSTSSILGAASAHASPAPPAPGRLSPQPPDSGPPAAGGAQIRRRSSTHGTPPGSAKPTPPPSPGRVTRSPRAEAAVIRESAGAPPAVAGPVKPGGLQAPLAAHRRSKSGGAVLAQAKVEGVAVQPEAASHNPLAALAASAAQQAGSGKQYDASYMRKLSALKRPPPHVVEHASGLQAPPQGEPASQAPEQHQRQRARWDTGPAAAAAAPHAPEGPHHQGPGLAAEPSAGESLLLSSSLGGPAAVKAAALSAGMTPAQAALAALASTRPGSRGRPVTPAGPSGVKSKRSTRKGVSRAARERISSPVVLGMGDSQQQHDHMPAGAHSSGEGHPLPRPTSVRVEPGQGVMSEVLVVEHPAAAAPGDQPQQEQQQGSKRKQLQALARQRSLVVQQAVALGAAEASSGEHQQQQANREEAEPHEVPAAGRHAGHPAVPEANLIVPDAHGGAGSSGAYSYPQHHPHHPPASHHAQMGMQGPEFVGQQPSGGDGGGYGSGRQRARWQIPDGPQPHATNQQGPGNRWGAGPPMYAPMALPPHAIMGPPEMLPSWAAPPPPGHHHHHQAAQGSQVPGKPISAGPYRAPAQPYAAPDLYASHPGPHHHLQRSNSDRRQHQVPWGPVTQQQLPPQQLFAHGSGPMLPPTLQQQPPPVYPPPHQPLQANSPPPYHPGGGWNQGLTAAYSPGAGPSSGVIRGPMPYGMMHHQGPGYGQTPGPDPGSRRLQVPGAQHWPQQQPAAGEYAGGPGPGVGGGPEWARLRVGEYQTGWTAAPHEAAAGPLSGFADVLRHRQQHQHQQGYAGQPGAFPHGSSGGHHPPPALLSPAPAPLHGTLDRAGRSAADLAAERRQAANAFEGLSLAEVLASAPRKEPPFPRKKLDGPQGSGSHQPAAAAVAGASS